MRGSKRLKHIFALLFVFVFFVGMMPMQTFAAENTAEDAVTAEQPVAEKSVKDDDKAAPSAEGTESEAAPSAEQEESVGTGEPRTEEATKTEQAEGETPEKAAETVASQTAETSKAPEQSKKKAKAASTLASGSTAAIQCYANLSNGLSVSSNPEILADPAKDSLVGEETTYSGTITAHYTMKELLQSAYESYKQNESTAGPRVMYNEKATKDQAPQIRLTVNLPQGQDVEITGTTQSENASTVTSIKPTVSADKKQVVFTISLPWLDYKGFFAQYEKDLASNPDAAIDFTINYSGTAKKGDAFADVANGIKASGYGSFWYYKTWLGMNFDQEVMHFSTNEATLPLYAAKKAETTTVTFQVENGTWKDGSTDDIIVTLPKDAGSLATADIPQGMQAKAGFGKGAWVGDAPVAGPVSENKTYIYRFAAPESYTATGTLNGDLLVANNTQHNEVYTVNSKDAAVKLSATLDIKPVKEQMAEVEKTFGKGANPEDINLSDFASSYTATVTLPEALSFVGTPNATLEGANDNFEVTKSELSVDGKTLTVTMKPAGNIKTFADLKSVLNGAGNTLRLQLGNVKANEAMAYDTNYTIKGSFTGELKSNAKNVVDSSTMSFALKWTGKQLAQGADSTAPTDLDNISVTVKYHQSTNTIKGTGDLEGDLLIGEETQHTKVYSVKGLATPLTFTGTLNIKPVKEQMASIQALYGANVEASAIALDKINTSYTATFALPEGLVFDGFPTVELQGANGKFEVTETALSADEKTLTVTMKPVGELTTFEELKNVLEGAEDLLKVNVGAVKADATPVFNKNLTVKGSFKGQLEATATNTVSGNIMIFDLAWNGKQSKAGADSTAPTDLDNISFTLKYPRTEMTINGSGDLNGDLLIGEETQHDSVYEVDSTDTALAFTGTLDVKTVKEQMEMIEATYGQNVDADKISLENLDTAYVATLTLPEELDFDGVPQATLDGANGKFEITEVALSEDGKTVTVTMKPTGDVTTFAQLKEVLNGADDAMKLTVHGAKANDKAKADTNYTVTGTFAGKLVAKAVNTENGNIVHFQLDWTGKQVAEGADSTNPDDLDTISFTLKYTDEYVDPGDPGVPEDPKDPDTKDPKDPQKPTDPKKPADPGKTPAGSENPGSTPSKPVTKTTHSKTGDDTPYGLLGGLAVLAAIGAAGVLRKRFMK